MSVAPNLSSLKQRLDRYFWKNHLPEMKVLHEYLDKYFMEFDRVAVMGGLVRDFAHRGRAGFRSDVDLVIDAPAEAVAQLASSLNAIPNRFGGYGFRGGPWQIDFWALETTWAARYAGISVKTLDDVIRCTFFDWDAAAYDLHSRKLICGDDYLERIRNGALDINLRLTPSLEGNLLRSIRRIMLWRLGIGPTLRSFIEEALSDQTFQHIKEKEKATYPLPVTECWKNAKDARHAILEMSQQKIAPHQLRFRGI